MRKSTLTLLTALFISNLLLAHNGDPVRTTPVLTIAPEVMPEFGMSLKDIFISDYDGVTLFVDFQAVKDEVVSLNVIKDNEVIMNNDVHNLPGNTIYEVDLAKLQSGEYRVELKTALGISIQKELVIE